MEEAIHSSTQQICSEQWIIIPYFIKHFISEDISSLLQNWEVGGGARTIIPTLQVRKISLRMIAYFMSLLKNRQEIHTYALERHSMVGRERKWIYSERTGGQCHF